MDKYSAAVVAHTMNESSEKLPSASESQQDGIDFAPDSSNAGVIFSLQLPVNPHLIQVR
jgi:hypothetical protein